MYHLRYAEEVVLKHIPALSKSAKALIQRAMEERLRTDPIGYGKPLQYSLKGHRRLRVSDYRVVYRVEMDTKTVVVLAMKHRRDVYEDF